LGDYWINWRSVARQILRSSTSSWIDLDKQHEGWCLDHSGCLGLLEKILRKRSDLQHRVRIINDGNQFKSTGTVKSSSSHLVSHFFAMSKIYDLPNEQIPTEKNPCRFGYFVGRATMPRMKFFHDIARRGWDKDVVSSKMQDDCRGRFLWHDESFYLDDPTVWFDSPEDFLWFEHWITNEFVITSIDGSHIQDQFSDQPQTNLNLVRLSGSWEIEVVFETCTAGRSFMPTEKTVRPVLCKKPFLIYGPPGFLANLQSMGFRTFGDFWDETYDDFSGRSRYDRLLETINTLARLSTNEFSHILEASQKIVEHNRNLARKLAGASDLKF
jgi:hypothetical protein